MLVEYDGISFNVVEDEYIEFWNSYNNGLWEPYTLRELKSFLDEDDIYIDIGAWIGPTTLYAASLCRYCYAIEPDPVAFDVLRNNVIQNNMLSNIILCRNAINDVSGTIEMSSAKRWGDSTTSMMFDRPNNDKFSVDALSFEDYLDIYRIDKCDLINMDVEGAEVILIPSMKDYLIRFKPTLFISMHVKYMRERLWPLLPLLASIYPRLWVIYKGVRKKVGRKKLEWLRGIKRDYTLIAVK